MPGTSIISGRSAHAVSKAHAKLITAWQYGASECDICPCPPFIIVGGDVLWRRSRGSVLATTPLLYKMAHSRALDTFSWSRIKGAHARRVRPCAFTNIPFESMIADAARYAERVGIPHIITPFTHLGEPGENNISRYYTMPHQIDLERRATRVIVQTKLERDHLTGLGISPKKMVRVGVGVNPWEVVGGNGRRFREKYGVEGPIVYYIGAAAYDKGTVHTIEAMQKVLARGVDATLIMAGSTMLDKFRDYYEGLPEAVREKCRWLGVHLRRGQEGPASGRVRFLHALAHRLVRHRLPGSLA